MAVAVFSLLLAVPLLWIALALISLGRRARIPERHTAGLPALSILKPLAGVDEHLEGNLESFFAQDHQDHEIVFGALRGDPAMDVARRIAARYPAVPCRFVVHDGSPALNPKVDNLTPMMRAARHDAVVISDANVSVHDAYAREIAARLSDPGVGLVTSHVLGVVVGGGPRLGARLDALTLNGEIAAACTIATGSGLHPTVIGKSMAFRRTDLERLGGLGSVASVLAEDYVLGRMFHEAGYRVVLARAPVRQRLGSVGLRGFLARHARWSMMRARLSPLAFALEPLTRPIQVALMAPLFGANLSAALAIGAGAVVVRDTLVARSLGAGVARSLRDAALLGVPRELFAIVLWQLAPLIRRVTWRGHRVRVSAGTRLYLEGT